MEVAMKDLEIRGAGNLLGGEQSGHIAGVGFDLYVRLVGEAVAEFRGEAPRPERRGQDRAAGRRAHPARLRAERAAAPGGVQAARGRPTRRPTSTSVRASWSTATASRPSRSRRCSTSPACVSACGRRADRRHAPGPTSASPRSSCPSPRSCGSTALPAQLVKAAVPRCLVPRPTTARVGGQPLVGRELLDWTRTVIDTLVPA